MNDITGVVRAQRDALLDLLEQARAARCHELRAQADSGAQDLRRRARKSARDRVSTAARQERTRLEREVHLARATLETRGRALARRRDQALLDAARDALIRQLEERWQDPPARRQWAEAALAEAAAVLLGRDWVLEHPEDWPAVERDWVVTLAATRHAARVATRVVRDATAGLRVVEGGAVVDMTAAGLVARRGTLDADLLAELRGAGGGDE